MRPATGDAIRIKAICFGIGYSGWRRPYNPASTIHNLKSCIIFPMEEHNDSISEQSQSWFGRHKFWTAVLAILGILLLVLALLNFLPVTVDDTSVSNPASGHDEAAARVVAIRRDEQESGFINPVCESTLMTHGETTANAIVFYHGFTSCPEQFRELGPAVL